MGNRIPAGAGGGKERGMRYLISGADGFLGANLAQRLIENGHDVFGSALNRKGHTSLDALGLDIRLEYGDVRDREFCERMVNAYRPDAVFHLDRKSTRLNSSH